MIDEISFHNEQLRHFGVNLQQYPMQKNKTYLSHRGAASFLLSSRSGNHQDLRPITIPLNTPASAIPSTDIALTLLADHRRILPNPLGAPPKLPTASCDDSASRKTRAPRNAAATSRPIVVCSLNNQAKDGGLSVRIITFLDFQRLLNFSNKMVVQPPLL